MDKKFGRISLNGELELQTHKLKNIDFTDLKNLIKNLESISKFSYLETIQINKAKKIVILREITKIRKKIKYNFVCDSLSDKYITGIIWIVSIYNNKISNFNENDLTKIINVMDKDSETSSKNKVKSNKNVTSNTKETSNEKKDTNSNNENLNEDISNQNFEDDPEEGDEDDDDDDDEDDDDDDDEEDDEEEEDDDDDDDIEDNNEEDEVLEDEEFSNIEDEGDDDDEIETLQEEEVKVKKVASKKKKEKKEPTKKTPKKSAKPLKFEEIINYKLLDKDSKLLPLNKIHEFRQKNIKIFNKLLKNNCLSRKIEFGIFNKSINKSNKSCIIPSWDNSEFKSIYINISKHLYTNIDDKSYVHNIALLQKVKLGEIKPENLAFCSRIDLFPEIWKPILDENEHRENLIKKSMEGSGTDKFVCPRRTCRARNATYIEIQTRSADEPMTTFLTCLECGKRWKC